MDTASRYDGRMMERLNLPRLATLALALLIGLQLAWIVTGALGSHVVAGPRASTSSLFRLSSGKCVRIASAA
jgi:hypothetical protein